MEGNWSKDPLSNTIEMKGVGRGEGGGGRGGGGGGLMFKVVRWLICSHANFDRASAKSSRKVIFDFSKSSSTKEDGKWVPRLEEQKEEG